MRAVCSLMSLLGLGSLIACAGPQTRARAPAVEQAPAIARVPASRAEPDEPREPQVGCVRPRPADPICVADAVQRLVVPPYLRSSITRVHFVVTRDGKVTRFDTYDALPDPVAERVQQAVSGCAWLPGKDLAGNVVSMWVLLPLRFWDGNIGIVQQPVEVKK
jgi:hypothetical protein